MPEKKLIFLHIPKTGGTSLRHIINKEYPGKACLHLYYPVPYSSVVIKDIQANLASAQALYGHVSFGIHKLLGIEGEYIAFLRHPIARVISFYNHNARQADAPYYAAIQDGMSLLNMLQSEVVETNNQMTRIIAAYGQTGMLDDIGVLEQALDNIDKHFCLIGLMERFPESVNLLRQKLGWQTTHTIPYLNLTPTKPLVLEQTFELLEKHIYFRRLIRQLTEPMNLLGNKLGWKFPSFNVSSSRHLQPIDAQTQAALEKYNRLDLLLYEYVNQRFILREQ